MLGDDHVDEVKILWFLASEFLCGEVTGEESLLLSGLFHVLVEIDCTA